MKLLILNGGCKEKEGQLIAQNAQGIVPLKELIGKIFTVVDAPPNDGLIIKLEELPDKVLSL